MSNQIEIDKIKQEWFSWVHNNWETIQNNCDYFSEEDKKCRLISNKEYEDMLKGIEFTFKKCSQENCPGRK